MGIVAATEILPDTGSNAKLVTFTDGRTFVYDARRLAPADPGGDPQAGMLVLYGEAPDGVWHVLMRELRKVAGEAPIPLSWKPLPSSSAPA